MTRRTFWAALGFGSAAQAQSIAARPTLSSANHKILMLTPDGPMGASLGVGLSVTPQPGGITLNVQQSPVTAVLSDRFLTFDATTKTITVSGLVTLFRNGIKLLEGPQADYIRTPTGVQILCATESTDQWSGLCN